MVPKMPKYGHPKSAHFFGHILAHLIENYVVGRNPELKFGDPKMHVFLFLKLVHACRERVLIWGNGWGNARF